MRKLNKVMLGAAIAGILGGVAAGPVMAAKSDVQCSGVNACKGKGACKSSANACKGQNGCKGQSFVKVSKSVCDQLGGTVAAPAAPADVTPKQ